jgi:hypothetical protein
MADSALVIHWGTPHVGREAASLALFTEVMQYWEGQKASGAVTDFRTYIATNGSVTDRGGFMVIEGSRESLDKLSNGEDYRRHLVKAIHMLSGVDVRRFDTGPQIGNAVERILAVRKELGIV